MVLNGFRNPARQFLALALALYGGVIAGRSAEEIIEFREGLAIGSVGRSGRNPFHTDAIEELIVKGHWRAPKEGETITRADGTNRTWRAVTADPEGTFSSPELRGGYLYASVVVEAPEVRMLEAAGHNMVYVNGEPRAGDPYSNGSLSLPLALTPGTNEFLFSVGRGRLNAKLTRPKAAIHFSTRDWTLPDVVRGEAGELWGAIPLINATESALKDLVITSEFSGTDGVQEDVPSVGPLTVRKVPFKFRAPANLPDTNSIELTVTVRRGSEALDRTKIGIRIRQATDHYKQTFRSGIDGSIQYYAVAPPNPWPRPGDSLALFLSTHGASVEAMGQADAYASKSWGYLVAPTNRRPYGFDWEDWGRADALEVLNLTQAKFKTDPTQTYLTGHSMGGHGAWQLGVTFPDRFAAVAPSAGWISFWSYAGSRKSENPSPAEELVQRASTGSDTLVLASNYLQHAIYVLHGDKDDNVPVSEARKMRERLSEFHRDFQYHEQPGAGHWWGNACVDWPPIFNMFARHKIPAPGMVTHLRFSTANPGVSASNHWAVIEAQERSLARSSIDISYDAGARKYSGSTENVRSLALDTRSFAPQGPLTLELDGEKLEAPCTNVVRLERRDGKWALAQGLNPEAKGPHRYGPFKEAFRNNMVFVYGTRGTPEENKWAYSRARYDAETWWYRGNGAVDVVADADFDARAQPDRGVVLYGNAENNAAWKPLLDDSPVQVSRTSVELGDRKAEGEDLACLLIRPRPGSHTALVAAVSGTGLAGMRLTERVPYFLAGVAYPDCIIFGSDTLSVGAKGIRAAGFFGNDWTVENGEFAWADPSSK